MPGMVDTAALEAQLRARDDEAAVRFVRVIDAGGHWLSKESVSVATLRDQWSDDENVDLNLWHNGALTILGGDLVRAALADTDEVALVEVAFRYYGSLGLEFWRAFLAPTTGVLVACAGFAGNCDRPRPAPDLVDRDTLPTTIPEIVAVLREEDIDISDVREIDLVEGQRLFAGRWCEPSDRRANEEVVLAAAEVTYAIEHKDVARRPGYVVVVEATREDFGAVMPYVLTWEDGRLVPEEWLAWRYC